MLRGLRIVTFLEGMKQMITNAILNFFFGIFGHLFSILPIPDTPVWVEDTLDFICEWVGKGIRLFSWVFPEAIYQDMIGILTSLLLVRVSYDLFVKFHVFRIGSSS